MSAAGAPNGDAPFVGRAPEMTTIDALWKVARTSGNQLVLVSGEPGVGKTRLVAEAARAIADQDGLVLYGHWDEEPIAPVNR